MTETKENTCYKVLHKSRAGTLYSAAFDVLPKGTITRYFKTKENFPKLADTPIFAFQEFGFALDFFEVMSGRRDLVIYECRYSNFFHYDMAEVLIPRRSYARDFEKYWKYGTSQSEKLCPVTRGTIFVTSLFLIEQVYKHKEAR